MVDLDTGYLILDTGCAMLVARYWMLDARGSILDKGNRSGVQSSGFRSQPRTQNPKRGTPIRGHTVNGNLIVKNASQLVTCSGFKAKQGIEMSELHVIEDGAVVIENGTITAVGKTADILSDSVAESKYDVVDAKGKAVLPGFVDSHTHFVFGGYRAEEYSWRLSGVSYMDIMKRGGGILSTVKATREASKEELIASGMDRLNSMLSFGVTTVEGKSGYGLDHDTEIKQLEVMEHLNEKHPMDIVNTFLGAHAIPEAYKGKEDAFIDFLIHDVLP